MNVNRWNHATNIWKWNAKYFNKALIYGNGKYSSSHVNQRRIIDIALLVSSWPVIETLIKHHCLTGLTIADYYFYQKNMPNLKLPPCPSIKNYQLYLNDRGIIWQKLTHAMKTRLGA